jgi:hypothetical protein
MHLVASEPPPAERQAFAHQLHRPLNRLLALARTLAGIWRKHRDRLAAPGDHDRLAALGFV